MAKNFYGVLGVAQSATDEEIRSRFKQLARAKHPDRFQGVEKEAAEVEFQALTEAFNVLTDADRRRVHDLDISRQGTLRARSGAPGGEDRGQLVKTYLARGVQAYKEGKFGAAAESFARATEVEPKNPQAWFNLALTCSREARWLSRGVEAVERACELEPMKPSYLKLAGRLFVRAGKPEEAERFFQEALTWGGSDAEVEAALEKLRGGRKGRRGFFGKGT